MVRNVTLSKNTLAYLCIETVGIAWFSNHISIGKIFFDILSFRENISRHFIVSKKYFSGIFRLEKVMFRNLSFRRIIVQKYFVSHAASCKSPFRLFNFDNYAFLRFVIEGRFFSVVCVHLHFFSGINKI